MNIPFWYEDPLILVNRKYIYEIIPLKSYNYNRNLNAIMRLAIIYSIFIYIYTHNSNIFCLPFITIIITMYLYKYPININKNIETFENDSNNSNNIDLSDTNINNVVNSDIFIDCNNFDENIYRKPTRDNPMMNLNLLTDTPGMINNNINSKQAIPSFDNICVSDMVNENLSKGLYKDPNDIWGRRNSERQFYTMPNTTINNHEIKLGKWLYETPPTCKEGNGLQCSANIPSKLTLGHIAGYTSPGK